MWKCTYVHVYVHLALSELYRTISTLGIGQGCNVFNQNYNISPGLSFLGWDLIVSRKDSSDFLDSGVDTSEFR